MASNSSQQYTFNSANGAASKYTSYTISPVNESRSIKFNSNASKASPKNKHRNAPPIKNRPLPSMPNKRLPSNPHNNTNQHTSTYNHTSRNLPTFPIAKAITRDHNQQNTNASALVNNYKKKNNSKSSHTHSHSSLSFARKATKNHHFKTKNRNKDKGTKEAQLSPNITPTSPHQRSQSTNIANIAKQSLPQANHTSTVFTFTTNAQSPNYNTRTAYKTTINHHTESLGPSTALGNSQAASCSYTHIPPAPMHNAPSVAYLYAPNDNKPIAVLDNSENISNNNNNNNYNNKNNYKKKKNKNKNNNSNKKKKNKKKNNTNTNNNINNEHRIHIQHHKQKQQQQHKQQINSAFVVPPPPLIPPPPPQTEAQDEIIPPPPPLSQIMKSHSKSPRSLSYRNLFQEQMLIPKNKKQLTQSLFIDKADLIDSDDDDSNNCKAKKMSKKHKSHSPQIYHHYNKRKHFKSNTISGASKKRKSRHKNNRDRAANQLLLKQSKSKNDIKQSTVARDEDEEKVINKIQIKQKENEDWQIMGDLLFSIRHSLICRMHESDYMHTHNDDDDDDDNKRKRKKKKKEHLEVTQNEWQTFIFEEYAANIFASLRSKWLQCRMHSDAYIRRMFGDANDSISVQKLDINKSCKYYWRRLNTNSKSGQIFFQSVNGEYIIKSMPKSEADFFRKSFLEKYYEYMRLQPDSLLMHIMGFYFIQYKNMEMELASNNEYNAKRKQDVNKGVYVIVMKSILFCEMTPTVKMHKIYDLKGSKHNRTASRYKLEITKKTFDVLNEMDILQFEQEVHAVNNADDNAKRISNKYSEGFYRPRDAEDLNKFKIDKCNETTRGPITVYKRSKVLKDIDFMQDNEILNVGEMVKDKYLKQLRADLDFLCKMNVMDYSLLVGIHIMDVKKAKTPRKEKGKIIKSPRRKPKKGRMFTFEFGGMCETTKNELHKSLHKNVYFTGIIDYLQAYNTKKKLESYYKRYKVADGKEAISSVDAKTYANRLYDFIEKRMI